MCRRQLHQGRGNICHLNFRGGKRDQELAKRIALNEAEFNGDRASTHRRTIAGLRPLYVEGIDLATADVAGQNGRAVGGNANPLTASDRLHGSVTASLNGAVSSGTLSGTYAVNADCTGSTAFSEYDSSGNLLITATVTLVWDDAMREFRFLFTSAVLPDGTSLLTVVNGDARKLIP